MLYPDYNGENLLLIQKSYEREISYLRPRLKWWGIEENDKEKIIE